MFSTLRNRFGIPGVISVIALVFAMFGGAYAASNSGDGKNATASAKKAAKGPRGPKGAKGATGAAGPAGPAGAPGAKGDAGAQGAGGAAGEKGATGSNGTAGKSVVLGTPTGAQCPEGGTTVEVEGSGVKKPVCNGEQGAQGNAGSPWTLGGTLPVNSTETGSWSLSVSDSGAGLYVGEIPLGAAPISFPIPLLTALGETKVHYTGGPEFATHCPGSVASPQAASGHLCVYKGFEAESGASLLGIVRSSDFEAGADRSGATVFFNIGKEKAPILMGTWAVTG